MGKRKMVGNNVLKLVASNPVLIAVCKKIEKMCYGGGGYGESSYLAGPNIAEKIPARRLALASGGKTSNFRHPKSKIIDF